MRSSLSTSRNYRRDKVRMETAPRQVWHEGVATACRKMVRYGVNPFTTEVDRVLRVAGWIIPSRDELGVEPIHRSVHSPVAQPGRTRATTGWAAGLRNLEPPRYLACRGAVARAVPDRRVPSATRGGTAQSMPTSQHRYPRGSVPRGPDDEMQTYDPKMIGGGRMTRAGVRS